MKRKIDSYKSGELVNGVQFIEHTSTGSNRRAIFKCKKCNKNWETKFGHVSKANGTKMCKKCSSGINVRIMLDSENRTNKDPVKESLHKEAFRAIKKSALERNHIFDLKLDFLIKTISLNCNYCGKKPNQYKINRKYKFAHHGLDRLDNMIGYIKSNVVGCCKTCNIGKNKLTLTEWETHLDNLVSYRINLNKTQQI